MNKPKKKSSSNFKMLEGEKRDEILIVLVLLLHELSWVSFHSQSTTFSTYHNKMISAFFCGVNRSEFPLRSRLIPPKHNITLPAQLVTVPPLLHTPVTCCFLRPVIRVSINLSAASLCHASGDMRTHQSAAGRL